MKKVKLLLVPDGDYFFYERDKFKKTSTLSEDGKSVMCKEYRDGRYYKDWGFCLNETVMVME